MFRKAVVVGLVTLFVGFVGVNLPVAQAADACGQTFVYEKTSDFSDSRVVINFETGDNQIDVSANSGYAITKVELDVQNDGRIGYYTYATGPLNNFNPNPGNQIDEARVTVKKMCESTLEACSDGLDNDGDSAIDLADTGCVAFKPTLTVTKIVSGGSKVVGDFTLRVCPTTPDVSLLERLFGVRSALAVVDPCVTVTSGQATIFAPGWYQVSETPVADYTGAFTGGSCGSNGKLYLGVGDAKTCQLTNSYVPPVVDVCPNLPEVQETMPQGYELVGDVCQLIPADVCPNISGVQAEMPQGYQLSGEACVPIPQSCQDQVSTMDVVSDTSNTVIDEGSAAATWVHPTWTSLPGATWIWNALNVANPTQQEVKVFEKTFELSGTITGASLQIAADNLYAVSVNGTDVPVTIDIGGNNFGAAATYTLDPTLFHVGTNVLRFTTTNLALESATPETNPAGLLYKLTLTKNACDSTAVIATKIVCDNESDLPNWGAGGHAPITATTASDWVASHQSCRLASGWQFQYADQSGANPGDAFLGETGAPYTTTAPTNEIGQTSWQMMVNGVSEVHVREVLQEGYLPFSYGVTGNNSNDVSAELYCANDAENYDNFDFIYNPQSGQTYHCVAWNVRSGQSEPTSTEPVDILVETGPATGIATSTATLNGTVTPNGHLTDWYFEYGTDGTVFSVSTTVQSAGNGMSAEYVSSSLADLTPNTNYFYRIVGTSGGMVVVGSVQSFWTDAVHNTGGGDNLPPTPPTGGGEVLGTSTASSTPPTTGGGENAGGQVLGASTCGVYLNDHLRRGWKNNSPEEVKKLQSFLNEDLSLQLPVNGFFGTMTEQAVRDFQAKYHGDVLKPWVPHGLPDEMTTTGYVYKTTRRWINMIKCHELDLPLPQLP